MSKVRKRLTKIGSRFAFEFYLGVMHEQILSALRGYLASTKPEDIRRMVKKGEFPRLSVDASLLGDNVEDLQRVSAVRLMEYLAEARPDLAQAIQDMGAKGADYMAKLRLHLLELVAHPEKPLAESTEYETKQDMVLATCDKCGKRFPVPREEAHSIDKCPFCGQ